MDASFLGLLATGLLLGLRHAFDADHVVAVSTLASRAAGWTGALRYGVLWGCGHTATLLAAGLVVLRCRRAIPEEVAVWFELAVGVMLIGLGADVLVRLRRPGAGGHVHPAAEQRPVLRPLLRSLGVRAFVVGGVHGLAGSAGPVLLLLSTVTSAPLGVAYLLLFGLGSVGGMLLFSGLLVVPLAQAAGRLRLKQGVLAAVGCTSVALGAGIVVTLWPA